MAVKEFTAQDLEQMWSFENLNTTMNTSSWESKLGLLQSKPKYSNQGKREVLNNLSLEARCTIMHALIKENNLKQISAENLESICIQIFKKNNGEIYLHDELKIIWNKDTIKLKI